MLCGSVGQSGPFGPIRIGYVLGIPFLLISLECDCSEIIGNCSDFINCGDLEYLGTPACYLSVYYVCSLTQ